MPFPPPGDLPGPGIEPVSPESPALVRRFFTTEPPILLNIYKYIFSHYSFEKRYESVIFLQSFKNELPANII